MKTRISKIIALAALMMPAAANVQAQEAGMSVEGSSYYLPQTALRFALQIEKSTYTPGEFAGYASRMNSSAILSSCRVDIPGFMHLANSVSVLDTN